MELLAAVETKRAAGGRAAADQAARVQAERTTELDPSACERRTTRSSSCAVRCGHSSYRP